MPVQSVRIKSNRFKLVHRTGPANRKPTQSQIEAITIHKPPSMSLKS
uniref:Uncharacterized protein n=1 Tax=Anguilla anguilla TaxID=7936 RepID=A0A0E9PEZ6_ANGAN